jgi:hypothetical protein
MIGGGEVTPEVFGEKVRFEKKIKKKSSKGKGLRVGGGGGRHFKMTVKRYCEPFIK